MNNGRIQCPECGSDNTRFRPNRGHWLCDDCDHVWQAEQPQAAVEETGAAMAERPARVFLSYAREDDEPFVRRLYDDLTAAGFTVWFDRQSLLSRGVTFHQEIKDAIRTAVDRIVYVGGPKAAISPFVREEWRFGLECDTVVVTPILRRGDYSLIPGELSLLHCEDFRDDNAYPAALAKLAGSLRQPNPKLGALCAVPSLPANFLGRPDLMRRVRDALLVDLEKPQNITGADTAVGMQGMGGIGKSVLAAALARNRRVRAAYPDGIVWVSCGQHLTMDNLVARQRDVARHLGGDANFTSLPQGQAVLRDLLAGKAVLLVLDDVWRTTDARAFDMLGPRCRMVVTTRDAAILHALNGELVPVSLFTGEESLQLLADTAGVPRDTLPPEAVETARECGFLPLALALSGGMARKQDGDFRHVLERLRRADLDKIADRASINPQHESIWRAMQASVDMLTPEERQHFAELAVFDTDTTVPEAAVATLWAHTGVSDELDADDLLISLAERSLIQLDTKTDDAGNRKRRVSLHDLLHDYAVRIAGEPKALHRQLIDAYSVKCPDGWASGPNDGYYLENLCRHLIRAGQVDELVILLEDLPFLEAKVAAGLAFELPLDFSEVLSAMPHGHDQRRILTLLDEALRRDIHFIARHAKDYPQALFQCLWNSGWWYDCPEAARHYVVPEGGWTKPPPWDDSGQNKKETEAGSAVPRPSKLHLLIEQWRKERALRQPGFPWVRSLRPPRVHLGSAQKAVFVGHTGGVNSVAYSPDGTRIVSGSDDKTLRVWDAVSGECLNTLEGHTNSVTSVAFSPDGKSIISGASDNTLHVWDIATGTCMQELLNHSDWITSVAFSSDGKLAVSGGGTYHIENNENDTVCVWDIFSGKHISSMERYQCSVSSVAFSPNDTHIASSSDEEHIVRVWDIIVGACLHILNGHKFSVACVAFSPDGTRVASGSNDKTLRVWDASTGACINTLKGHMSGVTSIAFSPDGTRIVSGSNDKTLRVWEAATGACINTLKGHRHCVTSVAFSPDGKHIVSGSYDDTLRVWDAFSDSCLKTLAGHANDVTSVAFSPDGTRVASGSDDKTLRVWDASTGACLNTLKGHTNGVTSIVFSPDDTRIASGQHLYLPSDYRLFTAFMTGKAVYVWDTYSGACLITFQHHWNHVTNIVFSPDGTGIASWSYDKMVSVWDARTGTCLITLEGHTGNVASVAFSPDGTRIASGAWDKTVRVWDATSGICLNTLKPEIDEAEVDTDETEVDIDIDEEERVGFVSVAMSPDGTRIASGSSDKTVRVWDIASGECLNTLKGHTDGVTSIAFSPDGTRITSGSKDETVRVWDAHTGTCLEVIEGHGDVAAIANCGRERLWRALVRGKETVIEIATTGQTLALLPEDLREVSTHSLALWVGRLNEHVCLFRLVMEQGAEKSE